MRLLSLSALAGALLLASQSAQALVLAPVILTVDVSDPSAVTFTGTPQPSNADTGANYSDGITLINFLTGPAAGSPLGFATSSTLTDGDAENVLDTAAVILGTGDDELNLANLFATEALSFSIATQALNGTATIDLASLNLAALLPSAGDFGLVAIGIGESGAVIGEYMVVSGGAVVPLPATALLLIPALAGLGLVGRRRTI